MTQAVNQNESNTVDTKIKEMGFGVRHIQAILMFVCLTIAYGMRVTMSVAIVAMTDKESSPHPDIPVFDWDKKTQGFLLGSFSWGYLTMQIPGSYLSHKYGAKFLLICVMLGNGFMSILTPFAAQYGGWQLVCACRAVQGVIQGSLLPSLHCLQGRWCPINERARLSTYIYAGFNCGTILAMSFSGFMAASTFGWPIIFYSTGALSIAIGIIWSFYGADNPGTHPSISNKEKEYIQGSFGQQGNKPLKIPWIPIFKSLPIWAIAISQIGSSWITLTLVLEMPTYLNKVMGVNMKANGVLSSLPFLGMMIVSIILCNVSDRLVNKGRVSLVVARKVGNSIAMCGASFGLVLLSFVPAKQVTIAICLLIFTLSIKSGIYVGFHVNHIDISPNFSGNLMAICNCIASSIVTLVPITTGFILHDNSDVTLWRIVFFMGAVIGFLTNLFYVLFGSAEKAPWNEPDYFDNRKGHKDEHRELQPLKQIANEPETAQNTENNSIREN